MQASVQSPVLVEVTRGALVESAHHGALAVVDADGTLVAALGDVDRRIFPRSAVKDIQALVMMESGAADQFDMTDAEIAIACASHNGEPLHVQTAEHMLKKAGRTAGCLECGTHWPGLMGQHAMYGKAALALARSGKEPNELHNNCSGKHAGFVCACVAMEEDPKGYIGADHALQREVTAAQETVFDMALGADVRGTDGCSIPTYAIPLRTLAHGFARFGTGVGFQPVRGKAARRIRTACAAEPFMVAGTARFDTAIMTALRERAFTKTGAEGVFCAALPEVGLGIALKIDDGAGRAAEVAMASLIATFLDLSDTERAAVDAATNVTFANWNRMDVGGLRPAPLLANLRR